MADVLLTDQILTKESVMQFRNSLVLSKNVNTEHTTEFKKIGDTIDIRNATLFEATAGETLGAIPDVIEGKNSLTVSNRQKVAMSFTSKDLALSIENFSERYIQPAMAELAQKVDSAVADLYKQVWNFSGTPGTPPATFLDIGNAGALMTDLGVPESQRLAFYSPLASVSLANGLKAVFVQGPAKLAIERAKIGFYANFDVFTSASIATHVSGIATGAPTVNGANQDTTWLLTASTGTQQLITTAWTASTNGILKEGDVFTIAGVNSVNRSSRVDTGRLAQFVVRADVNSAALGAATLTISPPIIISGAYQTVTKAPGNGDVITVISGASPGSYRQNLLFNKNAFTLAVVGIDDNTPGANSSVASEDGISLRIVSQYDITNDKSTWRIDVQFGVAAQNPGFALRHTS